jgi:hypothetical protein
MPGGRHSLGPGRRVALRNFGYRESRARVEFAAYAAHVQLPRYFGPDELSVPADWVAAVDLTAPGTPRDPAAIGAHFPGRTIPYLPTASSRRAPTTLLLFAAPRPVPPLRASAALRPGVRLPFGFWSSRRRPVPQVDGVLLRADNPRWAVDRFVAAGCMRGVHRDGGWYADHRSASAARPGSDPPWSRAAVDRLDGAARLLALALVPLAAALAGWLSTPAWVWGALVVAVVAAVVCQVAAERLYRRPPEPQPRPDKPSHRVLGGPPPASGPPPGVSPGAGPPSQVRRMVRTQPG